MSGTRAVGRHRDLVARLPAGLRRRRPRANRPAPTRHALPRLAAWLDDLSTLGCNGPAARPGLRLETHGYDTVDHLRDRPAARRRRRRRRAVRRLPQERGIRVLLDGVFNHVGRSHPWSREAVAAGRARAAAVRFATGPAAARSTASRCRCSRATTAWSRWTTTHPEVVDDVVRRHGRTGSSRGVDGWRLDAAYAVPAAFWRATVAARVRARHPDAWFVGEVIHGDYVALRAGVGGWTRSPSTSCGRRSGARIEERNCFELAWALQRHDEFLGAFLPLTFVGNHDVTRIASASTDPRHLPHAARRAVHRGRHPGGVRRRRARAHRRQGGAREGGDDAVRPEFPTAPTDWPHDEVFHRYQEAISFRRRHPWLARARVTASELSNEAVLLTATGAHGEHAELGPQPVRPRGRPRGATGPGARLVADLGRSEFPTAPRTPRPPGAHEVDAGPVWDGPRTTQEGP